MHNIQSSQSANSASAIPAILLLDPDADTQAINTSLEHLVKFVPDNVKIVILTTSQANGQETSSHIQFVRTTSDAYANLLGQLRYHQVLEWLTCLRAGQCVEESDIPDVAKHRSIVPITVQNNIASTQAPEPVPKPTANTLASALSGMLQITPIH